MSCVDRYGISTQWAYGLYIVSMVTKGLRDVKFDTFLTIAVVTLKGLGFVILTKADSTA